MDQEATHTNSSEDEILSGIEVDYAGSLKVRVPHFLLPRGRII
jgi:hypothetical protein